jgi:hypothetical protein
MAAAIAITNLPEDATAALIKELISYTDSMKRFHQDRVSSEHTALATCSRLVQRDWEKDEGCPARLVVALRLRYV